MVCPVVDGYTGVDFTGDEDVYRPDVAKNFHTPLAVTAGFELKLQLARVAAGPHDIGTAVILGDGKAYPIGDVVHVVVKP